MKKFFPPLIWALVVGILTLIPESESEKIHILDIQNVDKVVHLGLYFILTWLILRSIRRFRTIDGNMVLLTFVTASSYGVLLEVLQKAMNMGRAFENLDIIANISGVILGILLFKFLTKR